MVRRRSLPPIQRLTRNPAGWPEEVLPLFEEAFTCEFATLTRAGMPITQPLTPYLGDDEHTLDVSTGLAYPAKAERARRNAQVCLLYSDAVGTSLSQAPVALVYGRAVVRDSNIQQNTDRYLRLSLAKSPAGFQGAPAFVLRRLGWYFARIWIQVVPERILWWPGGDTEQQPHIWQASKIAPAQFSDPAPQGKNLAAWKEPPSDWQIQAQYALTLGHPVLTTVDPDGFPVPVLAKKVQLTDDGFRVTLPAGVPVTTSGSACLLFHSHPQVFSRQENRAFLGHVEPEVIELEKEGRETLLHFIVERPLADWSLPKSRISAIREFFWSGKRLAPRLKVEAERRGQQVPKINVPAFW